MAEPKNTRVYICHDGTHYDFLWGDVGDDGSVYFGLTGSGRQTVEQITVGKNHGKDLDQMSFHSYHGPHKISFHSSGEYTLANVVEENKLRNRLVARGEPLANIENPTRMMDVIVPVPYLNPTKKSLADNYIELGAELRNCTHICCTVYCMSESEFRVFGKDCISIIRGATWETINVLISDAKSWVFVLHDAVDKSMKSERCFISINGCGTNETV